MARIYIRGRRDPIEIANDRARKIKALRFGDANGDNKADPTEMIDLGDEWAGELGKISSVEIVKERVEVARVDDDEIKRREDEARMLSLPIEKRIEVAQYGWFKLAWWMRSGQREKEPSEAVLTEAKKAALDWYKENPDKPYPPNHVYEPILTKYWGAKKGDGSVSGGLADKMRLSTE